MAGHSENISRSELWGGDGSPFRISYGKQWMWMFLVSDALSGSLVTNRTDAPNSEAVSAAFDPAPPEPTMRTS